MIGRLENGGRITTRQPNEVLIKVPIRLFERVGYLFCRPLGRGVVVRHGSTVTTVPLEGVAQGKHPDGEGMRRLAGRPRALVILPRCLRSGLVFHSSLPAYYL